MDNTVTISNILSVHSSGIKDIHIVRSSPPSIPRFFFFPNWNFNLNPKPNCIH